MSQTPSQRSTKSNSNQITNGALQQLTMLIEKLKEEPLKSLEDTRFDSQSRVIESLLKRVDELTIINNSLQLKNMMLEQLLQKLTATLLEELEYRNRKRRNDVFGLLEQHGRNAYNERRLAEVEHVEKILRIKRANIKINKKMESVAKKYLEGNNEEGIDGV